MTIRNLVLGHINTQHVGVPFEVKGKFYLTPPVGWDLLYADDKGSSHSSHSTVTLEPTELSFENAGIKTKGIHTVTVRVGSVSATSNKFRVV